MIVPTTQVSLTCTNTYPAIGGRVKASRHISVLVKYALNKKVTMANTNICPWAIVRYEKSPFEQETAIDAACRLYFRSYNIFIYSIAYISSNYMLLLAVSWQILTMPLSTFPSYCWPIPHIHLASISSNYKLVLAVKWEMLFIPSRCIEELLTLTIYSLTQW